jgi:FdhE protein
MMGPPPAGLEGVPGGIIPLFLPLPARVFERRAARFRELAPGHAVGDYLSALAALAEAQRVACQQVPDVPEGHDPPVDVPHRVAEARQEDAWRAPLRVILSEMKGARLPDPARAAMARLEKSTPEELAALAGALLTHAYDQIDLATAPFVAAALQVSWTALAASLPLDAIQRGDRGCPVCGSPPVAARVLGDDRLRYLVCSLCATEWHLTRVVCATCGAPDRISYFAIEGDPGAVKAEACGGCRTYLKLFYLEKIPWAEPFADDVATLSLDLLMAEEKYSRSGVNLFLLPGVQP